MSAGSKPGGCCTTTHSTPGADAGSLRCHLSAAPAAGVLILTFAPWPPPLVVRSRLAALPAPGRLAVRDVRLTTRMGRTVRYLIPAFTAP